MHSECNIVCNKFCEQPQTLCNKIYIKTLFHFCYIESRKWLMLILLLSTGRINAAMSLSMTILTVYTVYNSK